MSEEKLSKQQQMAAQLLALGGKPVQEIADEVGVVRATIYNWTKKPEFSAEVDTLKREFKSLGKQLIENKLVEAVNGYWDLINKTNNDMVAKSGYEFFIENSIGKVSNNVKLTTEIETKTINKDILEAEQERWMKQVEGESE